ncbi:Uncharacterized protein Fot_09956 [Forsythia ovata]|uniref:Uncharacterized protein n=1 Tax=Forsythia ovata TaxID=205694 RepID=A0ABD1WFG5_9LAMI
MGAENSTLNIDFGIQDVNAQETNGEGTDYGEDDELESLDSENEDVARRPKSWFFFNARTDMECPKFGTEFWMESIQKDDFGTTWIGDGCNCQNLKGMDDLGTGSIR